jgi:hypothetical protein
VLVPRDGRQPDRLHVIERGGDVAGAGLQQRRRRMALGVLERSRRGSYCRRPARAGSPPAPRACRRRRHCRWAEHFVTGEDEPVATERPDETRYEAIGLRLRRKMPASIGTHCRQCTSERSVMADSCGTVLVAFASRRAATSPRAVCSRMSSLMGFSDVVHSSGAHHPRNGTVWQAANARFTQAVPWTS